MNIDIRDAKPEDVRIVAWTVMTALDMNTDGIERFVTSCSDDNNMYSWKDSMIAFVDDVPVGCLISYEGKRYAELRNRTWDNLWDLDKEYLKTVEAETSDGEYYLDSMAILPAYRGAGIGRLLIENAVKKARAKGCRYASLLVDVSKPRLESYYVSMGFKEFGKMELFGHHYNRMKYVV